MARHLEAARLTLISQACLYGLLLLCAALMPKFLLRKDEGGVSNYGIHRLTVVPYSFAFLIGGICLLCAAHMLPMTVRKRKELAWSMRCIGVLLLCVLASTYPYKVNATLDDIHSVTAITLFISEFLIGIWLTFRLVKDTTSRILFSIQALGLILSLVTIFGILHILFITQAVSGIAFGVLLVRAISVVTNVSNIKHS